MSTTESVTDTGLLKFLQSHNASLYVKCLDLRKAVEAWLSYVPLTFPHYAQHTLPHSEEVISQISRLLFNSADADSPVIPLSTSEAFVLVLGGYLHDVGMVVSNADMSHIFSDEAWSEWVRDGTRKDRWLQIQAQRASATANDDDKEKAKGHFLADLQTRFLIAEYLRRTHPARSAELITSEHLGHFGLSIDDPILLRTVGDVCAGHGLAVHELEDRQRYPTDKDVLGQPVNVRLMAILLRLGDLLDLRHDRACPLLMNAACPLPSDSLAHWAQYECFTDRTTRPDEIRIAAECQTQDEHRIIRDWSQWIVDECDNARRLAARFTRHGKWTAPKASLRGSDATIRIERAEGADYVWRDWKMELDQGAVLQRLIHDVYDTPTAYIRELLQNALDATRCRLYGDLKDGHEPTPEYPTQVPEETRQRYPISVSLCEREVENELSQQSETRQILVVEDVGIGMDEEIILRYFLQVARSYYTTEDFRRRYGFVATSRFGVGFLSVFAVSDRVVVETYKPSAGSGAEPIRLTLTGPREYLLTEKSQRSTAGTRIEVELRQAMKPGQLTRIVRDLCVKTEFPIEVNDLGEQSVCTSEDPEQFLWDIPVPDKEGGVLALRFIPIELDGIEGEVYVVERRHDGQSSWDTAWYQGEELPVKHPGWICPPKLENTLCFHGISTYGDLRRALHYSSYGFSVRVDLRGDFPAVGLARSGFFMDRARSEVTWERELRNYLGRILDEHLASVALPSPRELWDYRRRLSRSYVVPEYWKNRADMIPARYGDNEDFFSVAQIRGFDRVWVAVNIAMLGFVYGPNWANVPFDAPLQSSESKPVIRHRDIWGSYSDVVTPLFADMSPAEVTTLDEKWICIAFQHGEDQRYLYEEPQHKMCFADLGQRGPVGFCVDLDSIVFSLINRGHPIGNWISSLIAAAEAGDEPVSSAQLDILLGVLANAFRYNNHTKAIKHIAAWHTREGLPSTLRPPEMELSESDFRLTSIECLGEGIRRT